MSQQRTALVTGANRGIGLHVTQQLLARGFHVHLVCRTAPGAELRGTTLWVTDLADPSAVRRLLTRIECPDVLVNNAGYMNPIGALDYTAEKQQQIMQVNLLAPVEMSVSLGARMAERGSGRVVSLGSIAGTIGHPDIWYGVTKAGLENAMRSLARTFGGRGVSFTTVAPGPTETDMQKDNQEARKARLRSLTFESRFGEAEEVAQIVTWLATDAPLYLSGQTIDLNNGANFR